MRLNGISTYALNTGLRSHTARLQIKLVEAQKEVATGRKADLGYSLGSLSSSVVTVDSQINFIEQTKLTNSFLGNRLSTMQLSMNTINETATNFFSQVSTELSGNIDVNLLRETAQSTLGTVVSALNVTLGGEFLFSGINTDSQAIVDYNGPSGTTAKNAVNAAFTATFGFAVDDPAAANITPTAMEAFIDGPFNDLFNDSNWQTLWTGSSDRGMRSKISTRELVENPVTAHAPAFRKIMAASVLISEFVDGALNPSTIDALAKSAIKLSSTGIGENGSEQARLGILEERVVNATERMNFQKSIFSNQMASLTDIDSYEAATRLNQLVLGLEASYSATVKMQSLSILNYI